MPWTAISTIIMLYLVIWSFSLMRENSRLKEENMRLMKKTGEYEEMKKDAKELLRDTPEIRTIKLLREKYGLSLIAAKDLVDSAKKS